MFRDIRGLDEFYITLSMFSGGKLGNKSDTLVFLDEIQHYPQYLTLLKFLREEGKFTYIASGSINDIVGTAIMPIEVKSGKDYTTHRALDRFLKNEHYEIPSAIVLNNDREVYKEGKIIYMPYITLCA